MTNTLLVICNGKTNLLTSLSFGFGFKCIRYKVYRTSPKEVEEIHKP